MEQQLIKRFMALFGGLSTAHQCIKFVGGDGPKFETDVRCIKKAPQFINYEHHLLGKIGLGIYVLTENSTCHFGVIDVDDYEIDYKKVVALIDKNKLPLVPCRSKSGGLHLYVFGSEPLKAAPLKAYLMRCAGVLELATGVEFRPVNVQHRENEIGMGITLPYFNAEETICFARSKSGVLPLAAFLDVAEKLRITNSHLGELPKFTEDVDDAMFQAPPCLQYLHREGIPVTTRNKALYNFGIYAKLRFGENQVLNKLHEYNKSLLEKPLGDKEVESIAKSVSRRDYYYKCKEEPICSHCDKTTCLTRQFGVGNTLIEEREVTIDKIVKYEADEPFYIVTVSGKDINLTLTQFTTGREFRKAVVAKLNMVPTNLQGKRFESLIHEAMQKMIVIAVPKDATEAGQFEYLVDLYFRERPAATNNADIRQGYILYEKDKAYFLFQKFQEFLAEKKFTSTAPHIYCLLRQLNKGEDTSTVKKIEGKSVRVHALAREKPSICPIIEDHRDNF